MVYRYDLPEILCEAVTYARKIPAATVNKSTMKYLAEDFKKNGKKYAPVDRVRIAEKLGLNCT